MIGKYPGDVYDSESFGDLFKVIGGILFSFAIIRGLDTLNPSIFSSPFLIAGLGYLIFILGFYMKKRDVEEIKDSIKNLLMIIGLLLILALLIMWNSK